MPYGLESITIYGTVRLLKRSSLYLAPFLTYNTTDDLNFPAFDILFVANVTVITIYYPGDNLLF